MADQLAQRILNRIDAGGPISVAEYMALCLSDRIDGYYVRHDPFGADGDFITAPEISQLFGEMIGAWLIDIWQRLGSPDPVQLVELGLPIVVHDVFHQMPSQSHLLLYEIIFVDITHLLKVFHQIEFRLRFFIAIALEVVHVFADET